VKLLYPQKLALTSPTSGGRSVGIVFSRTQATELVFVCSNNNNNNEANRLKVYINDVPIAIFRAGNVRNNTDVQIFRFSLVYKAISKRFKTFPQIAFIL
jgi:hypothetical protein